MASGPGTPAPPTSPRPRRRAALVAGALGAVAAIAAVVVTLAVSRAPDTVPDEPTTQAAPTKTTGEFADDISAAQLRPILLPGDQIGSVTGTAGLTLVGDSADLLTDPETVDPAACLSAWMPAQREAYAQPMHFGVPALRGSAVQVFRAANAQPWQDGLVQAVTAFDRDKDASMFRQLQQRQWAACVATGLTMPTVGGPQHWTVGAPRTTAGVHVLELKLADGAGHCQRGMLLRANAVIDVRQCSTASPPNVAAVVNAMAERMPRQ